MLASLKFRTEPYAALPLEYNLIRLNFSDFGRDSSSSDFRFGILVYNKFSGIWVASKMVK